MTQWTRASRDQRCGRCGVVIARGDPLLTLTFHSGSLVKVRCRTCADEPVPASLPDPPVPVGITPTLKASTVRRRPLFTSTSDLVDDWKARASREPGEDG